MVERNGVIILLAKSDDGTMKSNTMLRSIAADAYSWVDNISGLYKALKDKNGHITAAPVKRTYGSTEIVITDCNGFRIVFGD